MDSSLSPFAPAAARCRLRVALLRRARHGALLPHGGTARPRRGGDVTQRGLGRPQAIWPAAADQAAWPVRGHRGGELAVWRSARVDSSTALGGGCDGPGVILRAGI